MDNINAENVIGRIETKEYKFTLAEFMGYAFCHIEINKWSSEIYKCMLLDLSEIRAALARTLYCNINLENKKELKLAQMFGFCPLIKTEKSKILRLKWETQ